MTTDAIQFPAALEVGYWLVMRQRPAAAAHEVKTCFTTG